MINRLPSVLTIASALVMVCSVYSQTVQNVTVSDYDTIRIASYNTLNYPGSDATTRNPYFRRVIHSMKPDILVVQEMTSQSGTTGFLNNVMNYYQSGLYSTITFHDGYDTDNEIFYKSSKVTFINASYIPTALRDIAEYVVKLNGTSDTLRIYSLHLKASQGYETDRLAEATILRNHLNNLPAGSQFIIVGDYNIYTSTESAFQKLIGSEADNDGRSRDPINAVGDWNNNAAFKAIHTQSPRVRAFGGGSTGGMDDRFDIMLISYSSLDDNIITSRYTPYGNDGNHFNDSINHLPNTAVPDSVANGLHYASDHLPVFCDYKFQNNTSVFTLLSPSNGATNRPVSDTLRWQSAPGATQYDVYLSQSNPPATIVSTNQSDTTYVYSNLGGNTTYYWTVVAKNGSNSWSATGAPWSFTTITLPPGSFNLLSPSNGATNQAISGTLSWQTSPNATGYDVYLSTANPPLTKISSNQTGTSYSYSGLNNSTMYYWKVVARNSVDTLVASGSPRNFTTVIAPPATFTLVSPSDGALDQPLSKSLLWTSSANVSSYDLYMSTTTPPTTKIDSNITDTSYIRNGLSGGTTYYWKVVAKNQGGSTVALNAPRSFTTANLPISVSNLATTNITSTSIQLSWTDRATNEDGYRVYRASAPDSPFVQIGSDLPSDTESFLDTALNVNQRYYYKILPFNAVGEGDYVTLNAATLAAVPAAPELTNASYLSLLVTINPSSNPSSTQFAIQISADAVVKYLQSDGMLGAVPQWRSYTDWGAGAGITIRSLEACKQYTVQTKARNLDNIETAYSTTAQESTLCFVAENSLNRGWNLVSLPVTVSNSTKASLFPSSSSSAFYYQTGYKATDTLLNGVGYWLKFNTPETRAIQGNPRMPDTINLNHGWNIIGSTSYPFSIDSIVEEPPGVVTSDYFGYRGTYINVDSVLPMRAYWVKASSIGKLIFVSSSNLPKKVARANHKTMLNRLNTLTFEDNMDHRQTLYFGNVGTTEIPVAVFELPPPPPSGAFDVRFASQRFVEMFMADQQEKNEFPITIQSAAYPITVSWNLSGDKEMSYKINTGVSTKTLEPTGRMIIEKGETQITLTVGAAESASRPKEFALHQNYPNPFNPSTEIHYELPTASRVRLTIYNILGVSVTTLVDNVQDAGYHKVTWQPVDASGLYFYRLEATNVDNPVQSFQQVKRMMLLK